MSGHSKWSTIKRKKGAIDAARSKVFQKLAKELYVAAKSGDPDPNNNAQLRMVVEKAKSENMPKANIESAIAKAANKSGGENYDSIRYEGYGPSGVAIIVDCLTDNVNRTYTSVKVGFAHSGFKLGVAGCVSHMFNNVALFTFKGHTDEEVLDAKFVQEKLKLFKLLIDTLLYVFKLKFAINSLRSLLLENHSKTLFHHIFVQTIYIFNSFFFKIIIFFIGFLPSVIYHLHGNASGIIFQAICIRFLTELFLYSAPITALILLTPADEASSFKILKDTNSPVFFA